MDKNAIYTVTNRSGGIVVYKLPERGIRREFSANETKNISYDELEALFYQPGGRRLMENYLQIQSKEALSNLNIRVEPEYHLTVPQIKALMETGSLDEFLDCLDFAPVGVIDIMKRLAVQLPLNDFNKRKAMLDKLGFDVTKAVANIEAEKASKEDKAEEGEKKRRTAPAAESAQPQRRVKTDNQ